MSVIRILILSCTVLLYAVVASADSQEKSFETDQMISELEKKIELSREQWEKLKPVLEEKSKELRQSLQESVDKGYAELEELSKQLEAMSKDAELKAKEMLSSEEARKIREYLSSIDEDAIRAAKDRMVAELTALLELTEEQIVKVKPILEQSISQLNVMLRDLAKEGSQSWETFKKQFDQLTNDLQDKLQETLDNKQMQRLEEYNDEQKEIIQKTLFTV